MKNDKPSAKHSRVVHFLAWGSAVVLSGVGTVIALWKSSSSIDAVIALFVYLVSSVVIVVLPIYGISALLKKRWIAGFVCLVIPLTSGVLFFVAVQEFSTYHVRSEATEGLSLAAGAKTAVDDYWATEGRLPNSNEEVGLEAPASISGNNVESITVGAGGVITVRYVGERHPEFDAMIIVLTPHTDSKDLTWRCDESSTLDAKYRPSLCRD
jgi:type IV pilus assembly protein PilA